MVIRSEKSMSAEALANPIPISAPSELPPAWAKRENRPGTPVPRLEWFLQAEYRACNKDWLEPKNLPALGKSD